MQDLIFTNRGPTAGLVIVEWNIESTSAGSAGLWDCQITLSSSSSASSASTTSTTKPTSTKITVAPTPTHSPFEGGPMQDALNCYNKDENTEPIRMDNAASSFRNGLGKLATSWGRTTSTRRTWTLIRTRAWATSPSPSASITQNSETGRKLT